MMQRDFYQVLGIARTASAADVRSAYIRLAKQHHPDAIGGASVLPGRLQDVQQAYRCLSDTNARAQHDHALEEAVRRHMERQRVARRRLRRYDRRNPPPRLRARFGWKTLTVMTFAILVVAHAFLRFIG